MLDNDIDDFIILDKSIWHEMSLYAPEDYITILNIDSERYMRERNQFISLQRNVSEQLEYLKTLTPITCLKPAYGYLAHIQDRISKFTNEVFAELACLYIRPFVICGTALGMYRYSGFIPWDDDVDFGLIRDEYMRLLQYGKEKFIYLESKSYPDEEDNESISNTLENFPNKFVMVVAPDCVHIVRGTSSFDMCAVDFFAYDFYDDMYDFTEHKKSIEECSKIRYVERGNEKILSIIRENRYIRNDSNKLYFGLDNADSFVCPNDDWIAKEIIFPLKEVEFSGIKCYAPNMLEKMLPFWYKDYDTFPNDISRTHEGSALIPAKRDYLYCGILAEDTAIVEKGLLLYEKFRNQGIYCIWILKTTCCRDKRVYKEVEKMLWNLRVEFIKDFDEEQDFIIVKDKDSCFKKWEKPYFLFDEIVNWDRSEIVKKCICK